MGAIILYINEALRDRVEARGSKSHYNEMNVLSMHALIGAYKQEGYEWVDELCQVLTENVRFACDYIAAHFKGVTVSNLRELICFFWIVHNGVKIMANPWMNCFRPAGMWASAGRMDVHSMGNIISE